MATGLFEQEKNRIMASASASAGDSLDGMVIDFEYYLVYTCPSLAEGTITATQDPSCLIVAACIALPDAKPASVAEEISAAWQRDLRYGFGDAHQLRQTPTAVALDFATLTEEGGIYVTGTIAVRWPRPHESVRRRYWNPTGRPPIDAAPSGRDVSGEEDSAIE